MRSAPHRVLRVAGFTLLELLVVLVLVATAASFAIASIDRMVDRVQERRWVDRVHQALLKLRIKAMSSGKLVVARLDPDRGVLELDDDNDVAVILALPDHLQLNAPSLGLDERRIQRLHFYPDGTLDDAHFDLVLPSQGRHRFHLARFSGAIEHQPVAALDS